MLIFSVLSAIGSSDETSEIVNICIILAPLFYLTKIFFLVLECLQNY
jgi:hypothetical protein